MRNGTFIGFALTDRVQAKVNVGSGDLLVTTTDLSLPAIGSDFTIGSAYNSLLIDTTQETGSIGHGWRTRSAIDVRLIPNSDGSVSYLASDGEYATFAVSGSGYSTPSGFKTALAHDGSGWKLTDHETGAVSAFDSSGLPISVADRNGQKITYSHNSSNQLTSIVTDRGATAARTANVAYDGTGYISTITQTGTDGTSRHAGYGYDASGNLISLTDPSGQNTKLGYDGSHNLASIATPVGKTTFTYDGQHRVTSMTRWDTTTNVGYVTRFGYTSSTQTLVADANTDAAQAITNVAHTTYTIDNNSPRVTKAVDPAGNSRSKTYTPFGDVATATGGDGGVTTNTYGANSGESLTRGESGTGAATSYAYGNASTTANPTAPFQPSSSKDSQGNSSSYTYDGPGNKLSSADASAAKAQVSYNSDGTVKSSTDPGNGTNSTTYAYDSTKQLTGITPPTSNALKTKNFTYDAYGRLKTSTDGAGHTLTYGYDGDDRLASIAYSDGRTAVTNRYDGNGNLQTRTDASGTTTYTHDPRNLLTARTATSGGGTLTYQYDNVGNLAKLTDAGGSATYSYDSRELLVAMTDRLGHKYAFGYDKDGRRTDTWFNTNSDNSVWAEHTVVTFDKSGRVVHITTVGKNDPTWVSNDLTYCYAKYTGSSSCSTQKADDTGVIQWSIDKVGAKCLFCPGPNSGGTISVYTLDAANRLTKATNGDALKNTYNYAYNSNSDATTFDINHPVGKTSYMGTDHDTFNPANQVSSTYTVQQTSSGTVTSATGTPIYDGAGNETANGYGAKYTYNSANQLTGYSSGGFSTAFKYAGADQTEVLSTGDHTFVYGLTDPAGQPAAQSFTFVYTDSTNKTATHHGYLERDNTGTPLGMDYDGRDYYFAPDGRGSTTDLEDAATSDSQSLTVQWNYDSIGYNYKINSSYATNSFWDESLVNAFPQYAGSFYQGGSVGLTKMGHRWYDPSQYRFLQQDTLNIVGDPSNGNRYAYAGDNPITNIDPTGRSVLGCLSASFGVGAGVLAFGGAIILGPPSAGASLLVAAGAFATIGAALAALDQCYG